MKVLLVYVYLPVLPRVLTYDGTGVRWTPAYHLQQIWIN